MRRVISIITIVALLFAFTIVPVNAAGAKYDLKQAIQIAKEKLELITEGYEFNSSYSENYINGRSVWELYWYNKSGNGESISVIVDASTGEIVSYNNWEASSETYSKLAKYSKDEALKAAEEFINKICPEKLQESKLKENIYDKMNYLYNDHYNFNYIRVVNGIDFDGNSINVGIDKNTLKVKFFYTAWDSVTFPGAESILSIDDVKKVFAEKQGLKLTYQLVYPKDSDKPAVKLVYILNSNFPIDAITGELIHNLYYHPFHANEKMAMDSGLGFSGSMTEQEQKEIDDTSKYIAKDKAIAASKVYLPEIEKLTLSSANLYAGYGTENASWYLSWNSSDAKTGKYTYISVTVDAVTAEVKSFYKSGSDDYNTTGKEQKYTEEQGKKIAAEFLNKIQPDKFKQTAYQKNDYPMLPEGYVNPVYNYSFVGVKNDIYCPFNSLNVGVNLFTGEIVNYSYWWVDIELPSSDNIISLEKAYESMYENSNLVLNYIKKFEYLRGMEKSEVKLAYVLNNFNGMIDANTGDIIGYDGTPYEENSGVTKFTDIEGHEAENDINTLISAGIIQTDNTEFNPDSEILQKDFVKYLIKAAEPYYYPAYDKSKYSTEYDYYYELAAQKKLITENEINPDGFVSRQEASKMLVRALGYGFIAEKSKLFVSPFSDSASISKSYRGYVVIANELGIFETNNKKFNPKVLLTNGKAATALVNFLKVETTLSE